MKQTISFVTDWGDNTGFGHIQRVASLIEYLSAKGFNTVLINKKIPNFLPPFFQSITNESIPPDTSLLIRDMRDSSKEIIKDLQHISPVLVIDDSGPGRDHADYSIDLLPPLNSNSKMSSSHDHFIYGYNFTKELELLKNECVEKTIDISLYLGTNTSKNLIQRIYNLLPKEMRIIVFTGNGPFVFNGNEYLSISNHNSYGKALVSTKLLITYFGITLYEGYLSQCKLLTVNPTQYHSDLTDNVKKEMNIFNTGLQNPFNEEYFTNAISDLIQNSLSATVDISLILDQINGNLDNFYNYLINLHPIKTSV